MLKKWKEMGVTTNGGESCSCPGLMPRTRLDDTHGEGRCYGGGGQGSGWFVQIVLVILVLVFIVPRQLVRASKEQLVAPEEWMLSDTMHSRTRDGASGRISGDFGGR
uniref:Uncharacterized protein n=1 Tax=Anopheles farauti TaxID=69004 RepID=A0A182QPA4_9DIPT